MKHLLLAPLAAGFVLLLFLLMAQLVNLNASQFIKVPLEQHSTTAFNTEEIDFSASEALKESEFQPIAPPEPLAPQEPLPEIDLEFDTQLPVVEDLVEPIAEPALEQSLSEPSINLASDDLLLPADNGTVDIPEPVKVPVKNKKVKKIKVKKKKPVVAKQDKPSPKKKAIEVAKKAPSKAPTKNVLKKDLAKVAVNDLLSKHFSAKPSSSKDSTASQITKGASSLGKNAVPISRVRPIYPKRAKRKNIEGEVVVEFLIKTNGKVEKNSLRIISAKPAKVFNKVVLKAVAKWRFSKAEKAYKTSQRLVFKLEK